jgi:hypothetical protein
MAGGQGIRRHECREEAKFFNGYARFGAVERRVLLLHNMQINEQYY